MSMSRFGAGLLGSLVMFEAGFHDFLNVMPEHGMPSVKIVLMHNLRVSSCHIMLRKNVAKYFEMPKDQKTAKIPTFLHTTWRPPGFSAS